MAESQSGRAALVAALEVRRNARRGFGFALAVTLAVVVLFVVIPGGRRSPVLYVALAFVLAVSLGGLTTAVLTAVTAWRLARQ